MDLFRGVLGLLGLMLIAFVFSRNRRQINWKLVGSGVLLQLTFGVLVLKVPLIFSLLKSLSDVFVTIIDFANVGATFLFANLADKTAQDTYGFIFALRVLPAIIFFSCLTSGLYYLGILQRIVWGIAWVMKRTLGLSGPEALCASGNIFLGQTESPLLIRPYLEHMTRPQMMLVMTVGMATIAGAVMAAFVEFLGGQDPVQRQAVATRMIAASVMNAVAGIVIAKILVPDTPLETPGTDSMTFSSIRTGANFLDALAAGAIDGMKLAANIAVMLLAFISLIALVNYILVDYLGETLGLNAWVQRITDGKFEGFSLQYMLGQVFQPVAFLIGVEWKDTLLFSSLVGEKTVVNELIALKSLTRLPAEALSEKSRVMATYALSSFSNFSSIAIQIGGLGSLAPSQRPTVSSLGLMAVLGGTLACLMTATIAGMLY